MTLGAARAEIGRSTCTVGRVRRGRSIKRRVGKVIGQQPKAGARRRIGTRISMVVGRR
jgi:beta-lactam-binding protein with PASTA domain